MSFQDRYSLLHVVTEETEAQRGSPTEGHTLVNKIAGLDPTF